MNKFQKIFEGVYNRFQAGGFLTGDLVKLKSSIMESDWMSGKGENFREQIQKFLESDLNIRISAVKTLRPQVQGSVQPDIGASDQYYADICLEEVPGKFLDFTEVPCEFLEMIDTGINLPPVSDSLKRDEDVNIKPEEITIEDENDQFDPVQNTKTNEGDKKLADSNTTLPGATGPTDSYTAKYMS